jgi:hypothetical protein
MRDRRYNGEEGIFSRKLTCIDIIRSRPEFVCVVVYIPCNGIRIFGENTNEMERLLL